MGVPARAWRRLRPLRRALGALLLLTAGVSRDHHIRLAADGPDEDAAIAALVSLVSSGLGEPAAS